MNEVFPHLLINDMYYYIESKQSNLPKQIGQVIYVDYISNDKYVIYFKYIQSIDINSKCIPNGPYYGENGIGYRHNYYFRFYEIHKYNYFEKLELLYKKAINLYLQKITGDVHFIRY